jgi:hypothetical protein
VDLDKKSVASLEGPDGVPVNLPATFLAPNEAELLRKYQGWLEREHLIGELVCGSCGAVCQTFVTTGDIGIFCDCRVSIWKVS